MTGDCQCFRSDTLGHWDGDACEFCYAGFVGEFCTQLNVRISDVAKFPLVTTTKNASRPVKYALWDDVWQMLFVGGEPFVCRNHTTVVSGLERTTISQQTMIYNLGVPVTAFMTQHALIAVFESPTQPFSTNISFDVRKFPRGNVSCDSQKIATFLMEKVPKASVNHTLLAQQGLASLGRRLLQATVSRATKFATALFPPSPVAGFGAGPSPCVLLDNGDVFVGDGSTGVIEMPSTTLTRAVHGVFDSRLGRVLIAGSRFGKWEAVAVEVATKAAIRMSPFATAGFCSSPNPCFCTTASPCFTAHRLAVDASPSAQDDAIFVVLESSRGIGVGRVRSDFSTGAEAVSNSLQLGLSVTQLAVTAMAVDDTERICFVALNVNNDPTRIIKFTMFGVGSPAIRGTVDMGIVGFDTEKVHALVTDPSLRRFFGIVITPELVSLSEFTLFALATLDPDVADTTGGTPVTMKGEGFTIGGNAHCSFGSSLVPATYVNSRTLICPAPPGGDEQCEGQPVEILMLGAKTKNLRLLKRAQTPQPAFALVGEVPFASVVGGVSATLTGFGFVPSNALVCEFLDERRLSIVVRGIFDNTRQIRCPLPSSPRPTFGTGGLRMSVDRFIFTEAVPFTIVGLADGLEVKYPAQMTQYKAADVVELTPPSIHVIDNETHSLLFLDSDEREVSFEMPVFNATQLGRPIASSAILSLVVSVNVTVEGVTFFRGLSLRRPPVGVGLLMFTYRNWRAPLRFEIVEGEPYALTLLREPADQINNNAPLLTTQPVVGVLDIARNRVFTLSSKQLVVSSVTATFFNGIDTSNQTALASPDGSFEFTQIAMKGFHGATYNIDFNAPGVIGIAGQSMRIGLCDANQYGVMGTVECRTCPRDRARCNGSVTLDVLDGYWRASDLSTEVYDCGPPYGNKAQCRAGRCIADTTGARCTVCRGSKGKSQLQCVDCPSPIENMIVIIVVGVAIVGAMSFLIYTSLKTTKRSPLPVFFKILMNYLQVVSQLGGVIAGLPSIVLDLIGIQTTASGADPASLAAVDCLFRPNFHQQFVFISITPWVLVIGAIIVLRYAKYRKDKQDEEERNRPKVEYGAFETAEELDDRREVLGMNEEEARPPAIAEDIAYRRKMLMTKTAELDRVRRALVAVARLPASKAQRSAVRFLQKRKRRLIFESRTLEDQFRSEDLMGSFMPRTEVEAEDVAQQKVEELLLLRGSDDDDDAIPDAPGRVLKRQLMDDSQGIPIELSPDGSFNFSRSIHATSGLVSTNLIPDATRAATRAGISHFVKPLRTDFDVGDDDDGLLLPGGVPDSGFDHDAGMKSHGYGITAPKLSTFGMVRKTRHAVDIPDEEYGSYSGNASKSVEIPEWTDDVQFVEPEELDEAEMEKDVAAALPANPLKGPKSLALQLSGTFLDEFDVDPIEVVNRARARSGGYRKSGETAPPEISTELLKGVDSSQRLADNDIQWLNGMLAAGHRGSVTDEDYKRGIIVDETHGMRMTGDASSLARLVLPEKEKKRRRSRQDSLGTSHSLSSVDDTDSDCGTDLRFAASQDEPAALRIQEEAAVAEVEDAEAQEAREKAAAEAAAAADKPQERTLGQQILLSSVVIFLLLYPALITKCLLMLKCEPIDFGPRVLPDVPEGGIHSVLFSDRSIDCNSPLHQSYYYAALGVGMFYGLGVPAGITFAVWRMIQTHGFETAMATFAFYTAGYNQKTWWWEGMILVRKLGTIGFAVFIAEDTIRLYCVMWFIGFQLLAHLQAKPYTEAKLHNCETMALTTIVLTLNLAMLFEFVIDKPWAYTGLAILIVAMNLATVLTIAVFIARELLKTVATFLENNADKIEAFWAKLPWVAWWRARKLRKEVEEQEALDAADEAERQLEEAEDLRRDNENSFVVDASASASGNPLAGVEDTPAAAAEVDRFGEETTGSRSVSTLSGSRGDPASPQSVHDENATATKVGIAAAMGFFGGGSQHRRAEEASSPHKRRGSSFQRRSSIFGRRQSSAGSDATVNSARLPPHAAHLAQPSSADHALHASRRQAVGATTSAEDSAKVKELMEATEYDGPWMPPMEIEKLWTDVVDDNLGLTAYLKTQVEHHTAVAKALGSRIRKKIEERQEHNDDFHRLLADRELRRKRFMLLAQKRAEEVEEEVEKDAS